MRRREFITFAGGAVGWQLAARAQQSAMPLIGFLNSTSRDGYQPMLNAFRQGLQELGYVEGRDVALDERHAEGLEERYPSWRPSWSVSRSTSSSRAAAP